MHMNTQVAVARVVQVLSSYDWNYSVDMSSNYVHRCASSGCYEEGICRCGVYESTSIHGIDYVDAELTQSIASCVGLASPSTTHKYLVDRIVQIYGHTLTPAWHVKVVGGYYGQEIECIVLEPSAPAVKMMAQALVGGLTQPDEVAAIKYILGVEYGYLLDSLVPKTQVKESKVSINKLVGMHKSASCRHHDKLVSKYTEYNLPVAVVVASGNKYRIVDGNHRAQAAKLSGKKQVKVLVLS